MILSISMVNVSGAAGWVLEKALQRGTVTVVVTLGLDTSVPGLKKTTPNQTKMKNKTTPN